MLRTPRVLLLHRERSPWPSSVSAVPAVLHRSTGSPASRRREAPLGRAALWFCVGLGSGILLTVAAALAALDTMTDLDLPARARAIGERSAARLSALADEVGVIGDVRGRGAMIAIELVRPGTSEPDADLTKAIAAKALAAGVVILTCGTYGNVIRLLPPLVIGDELLDDALTVLETAIREASA